MIEGDFETRSFADLAKVGTIPYAEHPTTSVICFCYGIDAEPIQSWWPGKYKTDACPADLAAAIARGDTFEAHNADFEWGIWTRICVPRFGWPEIPDAQWRDSMAVACYYGLPAKLDKLAEVLGFGRKDPEGARLITKYSKLYLKTARQEIPPDDFAKFVRYCEHDVALEQSISDFLGDLPPHELEVFQLHWRTNRLGLKLDLPRIEAASRAIDAASERLTAQFRAITGLNPTQRDKCMDWFAEQGLELENMQDDYLEEVEKSLAQGKIRQAISLRRKISKASTKKLDAMARNTSANGRALCQTRYHGAITGRTTGTGFQPLNLSRGFEEIDKKLFPEFPDQLMRDIYYGDAEWLDVCYGNAMDAIGKAMRYFIQAEAGYRIVAADFVSIEAVVLACIAGETWKIDAFREGKKIYEMTADKIYKLPAGTVTKDTHPLDRQDGKTCELAFGYQGALNAFLRFDDSGRHTDEAIIAFCKEWRREHPRTQDLWKAGEEAAFYAVRNPGKTSDWAGAQFEMIDQWLTMRLCDGKRLWYWKPELRLGMPHWHQPLKNDDCASGQCDCRPVFKLSYMAQKSGQFHRVYTYGGKVTENRVQAESRQILMAAQKRLIHAGYPPPILGVYDEWVFEVPKDFHGLDDKGIKEEIEYIMGIPAGDYCADWPIRADAWVGPRYKK